MSKVVKNSLRFLLVTIGVVILTSFSIDATDTLRGSQTALSILTEKITTPSCGENTVEVVLPEYTLCIDTYEVSPSKECIITTPTTVMDTAHNIADANCLPVSTSGQTPWTFVAEPQAVQLCAKVGKRLPQAKEWFLAALGTPDNTKNCNLSGAIQGAGVSPDCISGVGAFDMVGNVWELIDSEVVDGKYEERILPNEGYVEMVDEAGIALMTTSTPNVIYNEDYFWSKNDGRYTVIRGGYYGSRKDGGIYTTHAQTDINFASAAIGFRCVEQLP